MWIAQTDCHTCKSLYQEYQDDGFYDVTSPCATCFPGVHDYYSAAYRIYFDCNDQLILGFNGAVGINILAVNLVMNCYNIAKEDKLDIIRDIRRIFALVSKEERRIQKAKDAAKKKKG